MSYNKLVRENRNYRKLIYEVLEFHDETKSNLDSKIYDYYQKDKFMNLLGAVLSNVFDLLNLTKIDSNITSRDDFRLLIENNAANFEHSYHNYYIAYEILQNIEGFTAAERIVSGRELNKSYYDESKYYLQAVGIGEEDLNDIEFSYSDSESDLYVELVFKLDEASKEYKYFEVERLDY